MFTSIRSQRGFAVYLAAILLLTTLIGIGMSIAVLTLGEYRVSSDIVKSSQAYFSAEAGIEDGIYRIKKSLSIPPAYTIMVDEGSVDMSVNAPDGNNWVVTANGKRGNNYRKIETKLAIGATGFDFFYGAQAGELGISMENGSRIEGVGGTAGNLYSNGSIEGDSGATITGDVFVATGMSKDAEWALYNSDQIFGKTSPIIDIAQSFKPSISNTLTKASIYIKKIEHPDDRTVRILTDANGSPSKTSLAWATLYSGSVGTAYGWVDIVFSSPPNLTQGTTYWLMVDAYRDNDDYWSWGKDQNQGYTDGQAKYSEDWSASNPNWATTTGDLDFKIFMGGQLTHLYDVIVFGNAHANTITESNICGNAYYQTIDTDSLNFLNNPNKQTCPVPLTPGTAFPQSTDPPLENMPISDSKINQWKQEATDGGVHPGNLIIESDTSYGPQKIQGNLIMNSNNKILTVTGTIYVTGYIDISNGSSIRCSPSYGSLSCVVVADQWIHIDNNGVFQGSGQAGSYIMILTTSPCDGTFWWWWGCTHHNGAVDLHNNATGAIFYANDGLIYLHNGVQVSELTAKKINLQENATVRYEQGLINAHFSSGPSAGWQVTSWKEIE